MYYLTFLTVISLMAMLAVNGQLSDPGYVNPVYGTKCSVNESHLVNYVYNKETRCGPPRTLLKAYPICQCKEGYLRDLDMYRCVLPGDCTCDENEQLTCSSSCESTCQEPIKMCPKIENCTRKYCRCAPGFVRDNKKCIKAEQCLKCNGPNEEYRKCGGCDNNCNTDPNMLQFCGPKAQQFCGEPACLCKEGFVRRNGTFEDGKYVAECIEQKQCPNVQTTTTSPTTDGHYPIARNSTCSHGNEDEDE